MQSSARNRPNQSAGTSSTRRPRGRSGAAARAASSATLEKDDSTGCSGAPRQSSLAMPATASPVRSEEHTSELQSRVDLVCRLLLEKKKKKNRQKQVQM